MKMDKIKKHLRSQRLSSRRSTWSNAFASALAPHDRYDEQLVIQALSDLGQDSEKELECVYCGVPAATWDHVFNRVEKGEFSGYGHRIRNLVPCCRTCNERKGSKSWLDWLNLLGPPDQKARVNRMKKFLENQDAKKISKADFQRIAGDEFDRFIEIREQVFKLIEEADLLADIIRGKLSENLSNA